MRIIVIKSRAVGLQHDIYDLVGKEFDVIQREGTDVYIEYGSTGHYLLNPNEYEIIGEDGSPKKQGILSKIFKK